MSHPPKQNRLCCHENVAKRKQQKGVSFEVVVVIVCEAVIDHQHKQSGFTTENYKEPLWDFQAKVFSEAPL